MYGGGQDGVEHAAAPGGDHHGIRRRAAGSGPAGGHGAIRRPADGAGGWGLGNHGNLGGGRPDGGRGNPASAGGHHPAGAFRPGAGAPAGDPWPRAEPGRDHLEPDRGDRHGTGPSGGSDRGAAGAVSGGRGADGPLCGDGAAGTGGRRDAGGGRDGASYPPAGGQSPDRGVGNVRGGPAAVRRHGNHPAVFHRGCGGGADLPVGPGDGGQPGL